MFSRWLEQRRERLFRKQITQMIRSRKESELIGFIWKSAAKVFFEDNAATRANHLNELIQRCFEEEINSFKETHHHS